MVGLVERIKKVMFQNSAFIKLQSFKMSNVDYESYTIVKNKKEYFMLVSRDSLMLGIGANKTLTIVWERTPEETILRFVEEFEREIING